MRKFELTISVFAPDEGIPNSFREWLDLAFGLEGVEMGASPTTLERIVEVKHPLNNDVIERRSNKWRFNPWT